MTEAQAFFEARDMAVRRAGCARPLAALAKTCWAATKRMLAAYEAMRRRARRAATGTSRSIATQNLGYIAQRRATWCSAAALYESVLPLIERDRNPDLYARLRSQLGAALIARGEFDRALMLHSEALELFAARGDDRQHGARAGGARIHPVPHRQPRARARARSRARCRCTKVRATRKARCPRCVSPATPPPDSDGTTCAIEYLRAAERLDRHGVSVDRTRVLIARELRHARQPAGRGRAAGAGAADAQRPDARRRAGGARAAAHAPAAPSRGARGPARGGRELRALKLDFDRIDSSSALALGLLDAGDLAGAGAAADTAVAMEQRIRVKAANPEMRARFLSASYAPYEARIEVDLAGGAGRSRCRVACIPHRRNHPRPLARRPAARTARRAARTRRDGEVERLRQAMTALQVDLERTRARGDADEARAARDSPAYR